MIQPPASVAALFGDLTEVGRDRVGTRYHGISREGDAVEVWALASSVTGQMTEPGRFGAVMEHVAGLAPEGFARLVAWSSGENGAAYAAYARGTALAVEGRSAIGVALPVARGLATLHRSGMVHGAISTARLMQGRQGAELAGAGLYEALRAAGIDGRDASALLTEAPYASPEQQQGAAPDERSDVYSLGAAIYELLTGKPPFGGRTTSYVMAAVLGENDVDPDTPVTNPAQPGDPAVEAVLRAIERAPDDRWPDMDAFAAALATGSVSSSMSPSGRGCLPVAAAIVFASAIVASWA
jgi:hypothetical protein